MIEMSYHNGALVLLPDPGTSEARVNALADFLSSLDEVPTGIPRNGLAVDRDGVGQGGD